MDSVAPAVKLMNLRAFLTVKATRGNMAALHLLREMRGKPGTVEA